MSYKSKRAGDFSPSTFLSSLIQPWKKDAKPNNTEAFLYKQVLYSVYFSALKSLFAYL